MCAKTGTATARRAAARVPAATEPRPSAGLRSEARHTREPDSARERRGETPPRTLAQRRQLREKREHGAVDEGPRDVRIGVGQKERQHDDEHEDEDEPSCNHHNLEEERGRARQPKPHLRHATTSRRARRIEAGRPDLEPLERVGLGARRKVGTHHGQPAKRKTSRPN